MNSRIFHLTSTQPELECTLFPPLGVSVDAVIALTHFQVYNSIPNVDEKNNVFSYQKNQSSSPYTDIIIPVGTYELSDIEHYLKSELGDDSISICPNINTLKCEFTCKYNVDFRKANSVGQLFGIEHMLYTANQTILLRVRVLGINLERKKNTQHY